MRQRRDRGALLGVVLVLSTVLLAASVFAYWGLRSETSTVGADRISRQLFDCAEQGLGVAKQYFSTKALPEDWPSYYQSSAVCAAGSNLAAACAPNGPFPTNPTGTAVAPPSTYPNGLPFTQTVSVTMPNGTPLNMQFTFGILNAPASNEMIWTETDRNAIIYSRCLDPLSLRVRSVSAVITVPKQVSTDYTSVDGHGMRNQGNFNN